MTEESAVASGEQTCPVCGRRVSSAMLTGGRCPSCGAPLAAAASGASEPPSMTARDAHATGGASDEHGASATEDDSATRPVPPELLPTTILPIDAAPGNSDPTTAAVGVADMPTAVLTEPRTEDLPRVPPAQPPRGGDGDAGRGDGHGGNQGGGGNGGPGGGGEKRPTPDKVLATVLLVVVLLAIAVGVVLFSSGALGGTTPAATATKGPATATATRTIIGERYTVPGYYELTVPPGWGVASIPLIGPDEFSNRIYTDPTNQYSIEVDVFTPGASNFPTTPTEADAAALDGLDVSAAQTAQSVPVVLDGVSFTVTEANVTLGNGQAKQATAMAALHNGKMYLILYTAPASAGSSATALIEQFSFLN